MSLHDALGEMRNIHQFFIWRLEWNGVEGKYNKTPCALDGSAKPIDASLPANWTSYENAATTVEALNRAPDRALRYALGFWLTPDRGLWFFDLDKCRDAAGVLTPLAQGMLTGFSGALVEWSSSGNGLHIIGRCAQPIPAHRSRDIHKMHLEFYTEARGIAFGLSGEASGSADTAHDAAVAELIAGYFPPRAAGERGARPEWRGPADDDVLIERMLRARVGPAAAFGGGISLERLWRGDVPEDQRSNADMALASHLAFWTGCDEERMERLMRRSGMKREKWDRHRTYLRELTIANACASCTNVYQEPERNLAVVGQVYGPVASVAAGAAVEVITPETAAKCKQAMGLIGECGTVEDMHNQVIPAIRAFGLPSVYSEQLVRAVNSKLDLYGAKLPVAKLRALLFPPMLQGASGAGDAPLWLQQHCYVKNGDFFYSVANGARMTHQGFIAEYARLMPVRESGGRENPVEWAFTRWNITTVHDLEYRPDQPHYFQQDGLDYANLYNPASVPVAASAYSEDGLAGIDAFQRTLWDMSARRTDVYQALLQWLAHNVQKPGRKIRWSPCMKGCPGDAKTIISNVLRSAMGYRNVSVTGNSTLRNSGGFNDWAVKGAINFIEEVHLVGKDRHILYNAMKEFITNDVCDVNGKGKVNSGRVRNVTNHWANTNHNDALPLDANDRRWMIVFTPWASLTEMYAYCGLSVDEWNVRIRRVDRLWREHGSEARAWLLSVDLAGFDPDGSALSTPEKQQMMASSQEDSEGVAEGIIKEGTHGVSATVLSSNCLGHALKVRAQLEGFEVPRSTALNHMLTRLGFSKISQQVKWKNSTHSVWVRNGVNLDNDGLRQALDKTLN